MMSIGQAVEAKLGVHGGGDDAAALWRRLWALYEQGGAEAVEAELRRMLEAADEDDAVAPELP